MSVYCTSREVPFIFLHMPKAAGTSIDRTLKKHVQKGEGFGPEKLDQGWRPRRYAREAMRAFGIEKTWRDLYSFTTIRNPWDRLVSSYWNMKVAAGHKASGASLVSVQEKASRYRKLSQKLGQPKGLSFEKFIQAVCSGKLNNMSGSMHWTPQWAHLVDFDGNVCMTRIIPQPKLDEIWRDEVGPHLGFDFPLPRLNVSGSRPHYREFYTDKTAEAVGEYCRREIEYFGFEF